MADYQKMYAVLCSAVDEVIDPLERIPLALSSARANAARRIRAEDRANGMRSSGSITSSTALHSTAYIFW